MSTESKIKIIFFGSFDFAVQTAEKLVALEGYEIVAVVTNPDKPVGRKKIVTQSPIKSKALVLGLKILQPEKLRGNTEFFSELQGLNADVGVVVGYSKILPQEVIDIPRFGLLNIHPSLLPKYRGPSPVPAVLLNGETVTGVTIMKVDEEMDHGPILAKKELQINPQDSVNELYTRLFQLGTDLLIDVLPKYISGELTPITQEHGLATYSHMIKTKDGEIKTTDTVQQALNKIRALNTEPGTFVMINDKRLKILEAKVTNSETRPNFKLSDGFIELLKVQPEGGKIMSGQDWSNGQK